MSCKGQEMPTLGILGMTAHKIGKLAQTMYAEYDLNKSQFTCSIHACPFSVRSSRIIL